MKLERELNIVKVETSKINTPPKAYWITAVNSKDNIFCFLFEEHLKAFKMDPSELINRSINLNLDSKKHKGESGMHYVHINKLLSIKGQEREIEEYKEGKIIPLDYCIANLATPKMSLGVNCPIEAFPPYYKAHLHLNEEEYRSLISLPSAAVMTVLLSQKKKK